MRVTNHPSSHFGCGNFTTLSSLGQNNTTAWFKAKYEPRGMHLVYSHEPFQVLQGRVKSKFGKITFSPEWKGPVRAVSYGESVPPGITGSWVFVEPIKETRKLQPM